MHIPSAACRIASAFPDAKLIVVLRDPVMRAMSHWNMIRVMFGEQGIPDFDKEVEEELKIMREKKCSYEPDVAAAEGELMPPSWNKCYRQDMPF